MAHVRRSYKINAVTPRGYSSQRELNEVSQISNSDYESLQDGETNVNTIYENLSVNPTMSGSRARQMVSNPRARVNKPKQTNRSGADNTQRNDVSQTGTAPNWVDQNPRKCIVLAVVGLFLLSLLTSVVTSVVIHQMSQTNVDASQASADQNFIHEYERSTDSMGYSESDSLDRLINITHRLDDMENASYTIQANLSDTLDRLINITHRLDDMENASYTIQANLSDTLDRLINITHRLDDMENASYTIQANLSDTLDLLTDTNRRQEDMLYVLNKILNVSVPASCMVCPDGWTQSGDSCYLFADGYINFTNAAFRNCPDGWTPCRNSCYVFGESTVNFTNAVMYCQRHNASLVEIETAAEHQFLSDHMKDEGLRRYFWIGLTDAEVEGVWKWYNSGNNVQFCDWKPGEPNNSQGREDCTVIDTDKCYHWVDISCTRSDAKAICEMRSGV